MKKRIIAYIILAQITIVILLVFSIYHKKQVLGTVSVNPIRQDEIISSPSSELKHFYEPKPNSSDPDLHNFAFVNAVYSINSDSLNERFDYSVQKPDGVFRIITLGDSFTYGQYVDTDNNWTELLEDKLNSKCSVYKKNKFEIINLGVRGYDTRYSLERFKTRGIKYRPDLIMWLQVDLMRLNEEMIPVFQKYFSETNSPDVLKRYFEVENEIIRRLGTDNILRYQKNTIKEIRINYKGPLILAAQPFMPEKEQVEVEETAEAFSNWRFFGGIRQYPAFKENGHPNQKGHQMIAADIFNYLKTNSLIPCN